MEEYRKIQVREDLCQAVEKQFGENGFEDVEPLIHFLLEALLREDVTEMNDDDEQFILKRLRSLGYL